MDKAKEQQIVDLIKTRPDMTYFQIAMLTSTNMTAIDRIAKENQCQRSRGRKKKTIN